MASQTVKLVRGGRLLDGATPTPPLADLLIEGDIIREIGAPGLTAPAGAEVIDASGRLLMPGLVNAHTHSHHTLGKGLPGNWTLEMLLNAGPWAAGNRIREDLYLGAQLGAAEMIAKGCTACYDMVLELPAPTLEGMSCVGQAYADIGMRAVVAPAVADRTFWTSIPDLLASVPEELRGPIERAATAPREVSLDGARRVLAAWPFERALVRPAIAPSIPLLCSDEFLRGAADLAREFGACFHTHLAESKVQAVTAMRRYGATLTRHLDGLGVLGPTFSGAHAVWLDDDDMRRLADRGASVAHNPGSNMRLGSGVAPARAMREAGVNVGIGTDASNCSDQLNMFESMRVAALASRIHDPDYTQWLSPLDVLEMATAGSARVLGFPDIGCLAPGYKADVVFLDLSSIDYLPLNNAATQVVFCETGANVTTVMIGGRVVYDQGRYTTIDYESLRARVRGAVTRLTRDNAARRAEFAALEPIVGAFCVGLARGPYHVHRYVGS